jgi:hypothetical protein
MATCPRCLGPLTEDHRCPRGRFSRMGDALAPVVGGAVIGGLIPVIFSANASLALVLAAAALGAVLANAVRQALRV